MYEWGGTVSCIMSRTETTVAQGRGKATQNTTQLNKTQLNKTHLDNSEALCVSGEG